MNNAIYTEIKNDFVPADISKMVLTVGADHIKSRGGIGSVINVYSKHFTDFKYSTTHTSKNSIFKLILFFTKQYFTLIKRLLGDRSIKIIHIHGSSHGSFFRKLLIFYTAKFFFKKKVIYHMHGSRFEKFYLESNHLVKFLIRYLVNNADVIIVLSNYWKSFFLNHFKPKQIQIVNNVIHQPSKSKHHKGYTSPNNKLNILFLGALGDRKGIFDLIETLHIYRKDLDGRVTLIIGGNGETDRLQKYITKYDLKSMVSFRGWISGEEKQELLSKSDIFILPSYNEGLPISILEAMSYSMPIISTPVGGTPEVVHDGVNGFLVSPGDKSALYNSIMHFINNRELCKKMGNLSCHMVEQYLPETVFPRLTTLYRSMALYSR